MSALPRPPRRVIGQLAATVFMVAALATGSSPAAAASSPPVSIGPVHGEFFTNPNNSGALDLANLVTPVFGQDFPVIDFNPPASAQVSCSNSTGIDENFRPFTAVIPNPDGTCTPVTVQGNGQQAGVGNLFTFQAILTANLTVAAQGQVTFNLFSDDGWMLGIGPRQGGTEQPTYVSGSFANPLPKTPGQSLPVVGSFNVPSAPAQNTVTVAFPVAGTYPLELDYTECCGGQLSLVLGTSFGNPIPPTTQCNPTAASTSAADEFGAEVCQFSLNETNFDNAAAALLNAMTSLPQLSQLGTTNIWVVPSSGELLAQKLKTMQTNMMFIKDALDQMTENLRDKIAQDLAARIVGVPNELPCGVEAVKDLYDALGNDQTAYQDFQSSVQVMNDVASGAVTAATAADAFGYAALAGKELADKLKTLADALMKVAAGCLSSQPQLSAQLNLVVITLQTDEQTIIIVLGQIDLVVLDAEYLTSSVVGTPPNQGLAIVSNPSLITPTTINTVTQPSLGPGVTLVGQPLNTLNVTPSTNTLAAGTQVNLTGPSLGPLYVPGGTVYGLLGSTPVLLGTTVADANGRINMTVHIPLNTPGGTHELYAVGTSATGGVLVLGASITVTAAPGQPTTTTPQNCFGTLRGTINGGLNVAPGMVCRLSKATVNGNITVGAGAVFVADGSTLNGGVIAAKPLVFALCGDQVNGSVAVQSSTIPVQIGNGQSSFCPPTTITGATTVT